MFDVDIDLKRRMAGRQQSMYVMTGKTDGSDIVYLEGTIKTEGTDLSLAIGEKSGEGNVYKHFLFVENSGSPVYKIVCKVRVPKIIKNPVLKTEEGVEIKAQKTLEDDNYAYYKFFTNAFKPFRVESK